jgi:hypothetical protein
MPYDRSSESAASAKERKACSRNCLPSSRGRNEPVSGAGSSLGKLGIGKEVIDTGNICTAVAKEVKKKLRFFS